MIDWQKPLRPRRRPGLPRDVVQALAVLAVFVALGLANQALHAFIAGTPTP